MYRLTTSETRIPSLWLGYALTPHHSSTLTAPPPLLRPHPPHHSSPRPLGRPAATFLFCFLNSLMLAFWM